MKKECLIIIIEVVQHSLNTNDVDLIIISK